MKSRIYTQLSTLLIAVTLGAVVVGCSEDKKAKLEKLKTEQSELQDKIAALEEEIAKTDTTKVVVKAKDVGVVEVKPRKFDHFVQTQSAVAAEDDIAVSAEMGGSVKQVLVKEGQSVSKGQTLAQLDNSVIMSNIDGMKAQLSLVTAVYDRQKNLWDQKIGTEVQFLQAKTNKEATEKQLAALYDQNNMTRIKSPINGTVDAVHIKIGQAAAPGQPAFQVVNMSDLKIVAPVSEAYATIIKKGNKVKVNIPELKKEVEATVTFVGRTISALSRTFTVEVKLPANIDVRPNMTGIIKVVFNTASNAITVPINVVQEVNGEKIVYIAENSGKQIVARKKVVTVDGVFDNQAQVQGLTAGDKVINFGFQGLSDGQVIKI